ncbi:1,3-beta-glucanosyltransferase gel2 [Plectosphaerella cucumerina]|uniref:1,3-beta-glucanosyltransferase n=1 Tax=Plectosphaerella cucumerina TaxID=40658 RepID=A0A8K0TMH2_9PEZI|nr:1,3-beta-glucanosyltransferase gel2 [Plectosphaerella cucumerina]
MLASTALVALGATLAAAVTPLELRGNAFVNPDTGNKFQIVGIDYQINGSAGYDPQNGHDPLSVGEVCLRDAALMQALGVNAIRVYNLDPNLNHDACASIFNAAGMYMLLDVNSPLPGESINDMEPWTSYYDAYLNRTFAIVEAFRHYPNTLLFFSANEVIQAEETAEYAPPYLRAVTRDLRNYIKNHSDRHIPVGYSAADVRDVLWDTWNYMQCAEDGDENDMSRAEIFGLNSYSWCGESDFVKSTYKQLVDGLESSSIPVFFSEYGCNEVTPRPFTEVGTIYSDQMMGVFSGGLVYEYSQESHNYGLVQVFSNQSAHLLTDYNTLSEQYAKLNMTLVESGKPSATTPKPPTCSSSLIKESIFNKNFTLPAVPPGAQKLIDNGISPKPSGKIIDISSWDVPYTVYANDWSELSNLAVKPLEDGEINKPGTNDGGSSSGGSSGNGGSSNNDDNGNAGASLRPFMLLAALPLAVLFW